MITNIIESLPENKRREALENCAYMMYSDDIRSVIVELPENERREVLEKHVDRMVSRDIKVVIESLPENERREALEKFADKMDLGDISKLITYLPEDERIEALEKFTDTMESWMIRDVMESLPKNKITEAFEKHADKIDLGDISRLITYLPEDERIEALEKYADKMESWMIWNVIESLPKNKITEALDKYADRMDSRHISWAIKEMPETERRKALEKHADKMESWGISYVIKCLPQNERGEALEKYANQMESKDISDVITYLPKDERRKALEKYADKMESENIRDVITCLQEDEIREALEKYADKMESENIRDVMAYLPEDEIREALEKYADKMDSENIRDIITCLQEDEIREALEKHVDKMDLRDISVIITYYIPEDEKQDTLCHIIDEFDGSKKLACILMCSDNIEQLIKEYSLEPMINMEFYNDLMRNFGDAIELTEKTVSVVDPKLVDAMGTDYLYKFVKYCVIPNDKDDTDLRPVVDNLEDFRKYMELRENFQSQREMECLDFHDAIQEFGRNQGLIKSVLESESIEEGDFRLFEAIVKDKLVTGIESVENLKEYPQIRKEKMEELIKNSPEDATYELFMGMSKEEFYRIKSIFGDDKLQYTLENMHGQVTDELREQIESTLISLELIEKIESLPEEDRETVLMYFNNELLREFDADDKPNICIYRQQNQNLERNLRGFFEREMDTALYVPQVKQEMEMEEGIEVLHLEGEPFKVLVHVVDAFGSGNGHFERREIGNSYLCTSLISDEHFGIAEGHPIVAFTNVGNNALALEGDGDIYSYADTKNSREILAHHNQKMVTTDKLIENTVENGNTYNEVVLYREYEDTEGESHYTVPSYVVCFDGIDEESIEEAKRIAEEFEMEKPLPILVIHTEAYEERISEFRKKHQQKTREERREAKVNETKGIKEEVGKRVEELMKRISEKVPLVDKISAMGELVNESEHNVSKE